MRFLVERDAASDNANALLRQRSVTPRETSAVRENFIAALEMGLRRPESAPALSSVNPQLSQVA